MARITKRSFLRLNPADIGKLKAPELRELLRGVRNLFTQQEKTFNKYKQSVYSPALDKMENFYEDRGKQAPSRMNMNQMRNEVFRLQEFFDSDTATVPGARKVQSEQDRRIFGTDKRGRPKYRMTVEQRSQLWSVFEEYKKMRPSDVMEQSNIVQQAIGQILIETDKIDFSMETLNKVMDKVIDQRQRFNWEMDGVDYDGEEPVFTGKRPY